MSEPASAIAKTTKAAPTQGTAFDELLEQQKSGKVNTKIIKGKSASSEKAVYGQQKKTVVTKAASKKSDTKKNISKSSKKSESFKASTAPLKFSSKAAVGTQGSAPAGLELPVPKGAITKATKTVAPKPKTSAPKPKTVAPKPVTASSKTENPLARKKAAAAAGTAAVVVEKAVEKVVPAPVVEAPTVPKVKNYVKNTPAVKAPVEKKASSGPSFAFGGDAVEAGAVAAAEAVGLAVASSIVNAIVKPTKAAVARKV